MIRGYAFAVKLRYGYTLIEILVGITIIAILFGLGYASFREFSQRQALNGVVKNLQGDIRLAQQQAISGKKPDDANCNGANLLDGYNFLVNSSSNTYTIQAKCTLGLVEVKVVTLPAGVSFAPPSPNPLFFKALGQGTNISQGEQTTIILTQAATGNTRSVIITSGGEIK